MWFMLSNFRNSFAKLVVREVGHLTLQIQTFVKLVATDFAGDYCIPYYTLARWHSYLLYQNLFKKRFYYFFNANQTTISCHSICIHLKISFLCKKCFRLVNMSTCMYLLLHFHSAILAKLLKYFCPKGFCAGGLKFLMCVCSFIHPSSVCRQLFGLLFGSWNQQLEQPSSAKKCKKGISS